MTLRAVGHAIGVSHNAPYRHFKNRDALLAAVAIDDFEMLMTAFRDIRRQEAQPTAKLTGALKIVVDYSYAHPARYRLLFNDPGIAAQGGDLETTALGAFGEFVAIVEECQRAGDLPDIPNTKLAALLFATLHGLIALEVSGRMHPEKGLTGVVPSLELLIQLLSSSQR